MSKEQRAQIEAELAERERNFRERMAARGIDYKLEQPSFAGFEPPGLIDWKCPACGKTGQVRRVFNMPMNEIEAKVSGAHSSVNPLCAEFPSYRNAE